MTEFIVAALYHFSPLDDLAEMQSDLQILCHENNICGTILIAPEGINGTIAGSRHGIDTILHAIRRYAGMQGLEHKESYAETQPFHRMKVRLKREIVTMGDASINPNDIVGTYVTPDQWNDIISDPDTILIDTRNDYEIKIGTFKNAVNPKTDTFREFPEYVENNLDPKKNKKVAMFCTGGIRCEKASSYMKKMGFEEVYHLKGGILKYLEDVAPDKSMWEGDCFVFDQRVSVGHGLTLGEYILCPSCRHPISPEDLRSDKYVVGVSCPYCFDHLSDERKARSAERQRQIELAESRGEKHIGSSYDIEGDTEDEG